MTSAVAVVGAGGLGGPIALAVASAGHPVVVFDDDQVELSNLHRQIQFTDAERGGAKAGLLAARVVAGGGAATARLERFTAATVVDVAAIVDGSDHAPTKFAVAAWARRRRIPYVIAAAVGYGGNVFAAGPDDACYACLFEAPPDEAPGCDQAGVLGPLVGWIGGVAAQAVIARVTAPGAWPGASIWVLDDLRRGGAPRTLALTPRADCACRSTP
ncbi:MAG: ThiF family adenylyltransferase [Kofleriaceae bacterium]